MDSEQMILRMLRHENMTELSVNELIERDVLRNVGRFAVDI